MRLEWSYDGSSWQLLQMLDPTAPFAYVSAVQPTRKTMYQLVFEGDASHAAATSPTVTVTPKVKLGKPHAPSSVKKGRQFTAYGDLTPKATAGSHTVKIKCYQKKSGVWKLKTTVKTTNRNYQSASRYSAKFSLTATGQLEAGGLRGGDVQVRRDDVFGVLPEGQVGGDDSGCLMVAHGPGRRWPVLVAAAVIIAAVVAAWVLQAGVERGRRGAGRRVAALVLRHGAAGRRGAQAVRPRRPPRAAAGVRDDRRQEPGRAAAADALA